jgi:nucleoside-diphosphate-sugar epimerase
MSDLSPNDTTKPRRCLMSGASGYLGSVFKAYLKARGWSVTELQRDPQPGTDSIRFELGKPVDPDLLRGYDALVHCAYDFSETEWDHIRSRNVDGSRMLLESAHAAGIDRIVFISTISAYDGCRSLYGKGKLEVEKTAQQLGVWTIRPGLVFGNSSGAMYGKLVANVQRSTLLPVPGAGNQPMFLVHEADLADAVFRCLDTSRAYNSSPVTVAHERMWPFKDMMHEIARRVNRKVTLLPVPWRMIWLGLRTAEKLKVPLGLRSDSLVSLMFQNANPNLNAEAALGLKCRPFGAD